MSSNQTLNIFQIHITLPSMFNQKFIALIPEQRRVVNELLADQIIMSYALDMERQNLWITIQAKNQLQVMDVLSTFPIIKEVKVDIFELAFFDSAPTGIHELIMN
jgi:hypothetical protein